MKSVGCLDSNKEDAQSCVFSTLKSKVEGSGDEIEQSKVPIKFMRWMN